MYLYLNPDEGEAEYIALFDKASQVLLGNSPFLEVT